MCIKDFLHVFFVHTIFSNLHCSLNLLELVSVKISSPRVHGALCPIHMWFITCVCDFPPSSKGKQCGLHCSEDICSAVDPVCEVVRGRERLLERALGSLLCVSGYVPSTYPSGMEV